IMIHSRRKEPYEVFEFIARFLAENRHSALVVVPTSYNSVYEEEFRTRGVNVVIYANHLIRSSYPAMCRT
ncbi:phosphoenolpyruvate mutase, partial [Klebsiella oxytoca]